MISWHINVIECFSILTLKCYGMTSVFHLQVNVVQTRSFFDARRECQILGGDLASINSPKENAFIHGKERNYLDNFSNVLVCCTFTYY